jgi:ABC-type transport system involved in cytochrome bd biosynthesis fused ATPase/permease subunit
MPDIIIKVGEALVALSRVEKYLNETEIGESVNCVEPVSLFPESPVQFINDSKFNWSVIDHTSGKRSFTLRNISVKFPLGCLSIIEGPTGSGKSSLLAAMLGEMNALVGGVYILDSESTKVSSITAKKDAITVAYASQQGCLQPNYSMAAKCDHHGEYCVRL